MPKGIPKNPRIKSDATIDEVLVKVLKQFTFGKGQKSDLQVGARFVDVDGALKTLSAKGAKGGMTVMSYQGISDIEFFNADTDDAEVLLVIPIVKVAAAKTEEEAETVTPE